MTAYELLFKTLFTDILKIAIQLLLWNVTAWIYELHGKED